MTASSFALIAISVCTNAFAQIALRKAMLTIGRIPSIGEPKAFAWTLVSNVYLWGGLVCCAISILSWLAVLSMHQVSVAYPMLSIGYVIAAIFGFLILGETIPPARLAGIALICAGVVLIGRTA
ncbi:EamA family transporter [Bradyrhizobium sp. C-145]|uniref:EamA family transporter n=1 Tax=Bradyrhizobium sp. C-145 TaxID=574727 RepID=UPI00201B5C43|nr:EamA family transporter [Bradyrhizobium sp. C-145]UQR61348.1 EamA family transporter [Bradyrhizobium sp. C-145]